MTKVTSYDAIVVGAGPNGLAAAITIARTGRSVLTFEAGDTVGGGCRSTELTLPGFVHDVCSAIFGLGLSSPFFRALPLKELGVDFIIPPASLAHPLDDGTAVMVERSVEETSRYLGPDAVAYRRLMAPVVNNWDRLMVDILGPLPLPPRHPFVTTNFGLRAIWPATWVANALFKGVRARALYAGMAGHSMMPLERWITAAFGVILNGSAHAVGWPVVRGGAQKIADALANYLRTLGGEITTGYPVHSIEELPPARAVLFDLTPRQLVRITGDRLPSGYRRRLEKFRYGPGVFKIDYALVGPVPWKAKECDQAATLHLGGTIEEIAYTERRVWEGEHPEKPYLLVAQPSLFDSSRAPEGKHTLWVYCHVPHGSTFDMTERIEAQIERFAPGFRDLILGRSIMDPAQFEAYNPNYIGGDINGGVQDLFQHFTRPVARRVPYSTPVKGIYLCSSSTPPGGGVHGMCGYHAANAALGKELRV